MKNIMENIRQRISAKSTKLVSAPYLPTGLISATLLLAYTDWMVFLLGQPASYWLDRSRAEGSLPFVEKILAGGILPYALAGLFYLALLWLFLTVLTRSWALVLWLPFSYVHLTHALSWALEKSGLIEDVVAKPWWLTVINFVSALILGTILVRGLLRTPHGLNNPPHQATWIKPATLGAWVVILLAVTAVTAVRPKSGWALVHPEHTPGRRGNAAVAYDSDRQKVVLFGGMTDWVGSSFHHENDTWEWNGQDWTEMKPKTVPPARAGQMMAYDEERGVVVMFGGEDQTGTYMLNDTWVWDGKDWKVLYPNNYPPGRRGGQMFFDHETGRMVLLGGFYYTGPDKTFSPLSDVWEWDGEAWQYLANLSENLLITNPNVAYNAIQGRTFLFNYKETMNWRSGQWHASEVTSNPSNRFGSWLAADPNSGRMLLFGGVENNIQLNDTWVLEGNQWKELHPDLTPSPRDAYVMFFDPSRNSFILYGGVSGYALDDMWELVLP